MSGLGGEDIRGTVNALENFTARLGQYFCRVVYWVARAAGRPSVQRVCSRNIVVVIHHWGAEDAGIQALLPRRWRPDWLRRLDRG